MVKGEGNGFIDVFAQTTLMYNYFDLNWLYLRVNVGRLSIRNTGDIQIDV